MSPFDFATMFPTAEPTRQKVIAWWSARSKREQWLLGTLGVLAALYLLVTMAIQPMLAARAQALNDIHAYDNLNARLRTAGPIGANPAQPQLSGSPATILSTTGAQFGIVPVVNGEGAGIRVTIADAPYESVVRWIAAFEGQSALRVTRIRLDRRPTSGFVSAELEVRA